MKVISKKTLVFLIIVIGLLFANGCQTTTKDQEDGKTKVEEDPSIENKTPKKPWAYNGEPATVKMLINVGEEEFNRRYKEQIEKEFPNIELELMSGVPSDNTYLEELFAKKEIPDIITVNPNHELVVELDALEPIDHYIENTNFVLNIFRENIVDNLRSRDPYGKDQLYGLPIEATLMAMYYNKDIFDKFGEPYPTDNLTWEETLEIAKRLTKEQDGVQYKGLVLEPSYAIPYTQFSILGVDPDTDEVLFTEDPATKRLFDFLEQFKNIPGMLAEEDDGFHSGARNYAMRVSTAPWLPLLAPIEGFNFDMVAPPTWEGEPAVAPTTVAISFNIVKYSENKDAAWSVISYLASEEAQINLSRAGSPPTIESEEAFEQYGAIVLEEYGKNYNAKAPFINEGIEMAPYSRYSPDITFHGSEFISDKTREFLTSDKDVVTFMREMGEEYNQIIEEMKSQE